jgi:hypothetical protein
MTPFSKNQSFRLSTSDDSSIWLLRCTQSLASKAQTHLHDLLDLKNTSYSFRYENVFTIPRVRTTKYGLRSFRYTSATLWNDLPNDFRTVASFSQFKRMIDSWNGLKCNCNVCTFVCVCMCSVCMCEQACLYMYECVSAHKGMQVYSCVCACVCVFCTTCLS